MTYWSANRSFWASPRSRDRKQRVSKRRKKNTGGGGESWEKTTKATCRSRVRPSLSNRQRRWENGDLLRRVRVCYHTTVIRSCISNQEKDIDTKYVTTRRPCSRFTTSTHPIYTYIALEIGKFSWSFPSDFERHSVIVKLNVDFCQKSVEG